MIYQEKFELVVEAIAAVRSQNSNTKIKISPQNGLNKLSRQDISSVVSFLHYNKRVIIDPSLPKLAPNEFIDPDYYNNDVPEEPRDFAIQILPEFKQWYTEYRQKIDRKVQDLSNNDIKSLFLLVENISDKSRLKSSQHFQITSPLIENNDYLHFLYEKHVLINYDIDSPNKVTVILNPEKFSDFYKKLKKIHQKRLLTTVGNYTKSSSKITTDTITTKSKDSQPLKEFKIEYNRFSCEITLNGKLIHKPNYDSENDRVFRYLFDNPGKEITKEELKKNLKLKRIKPLSKILENLKFKGDLRKCFFRLSGDTIKFRNPITQNDLKELKISALKI